MIFPYAQFNGNLFVDLWKRKFLYFPFENFNFMYSALSVFIPRTRRYGSQKTSLSWRHSAFIIKWSWVYKQGQSGVIFSLKQEK
jgi:hypothetical protein